MPSLATQIETNEALQSSPLFISASPPIPCSPALHARTAASAAAAASAWVQGLGFRCFTVFQGCFVFLGFGGLGFRDDVHLATNRALLEARYSLAFPCAQSELLSVDESSATMTMEDLQVMVALMATEIMAAAIATTVARVQSTALMPRTGLCQQCSHQRQLHTGRCSRR